jgi:kynurenine formamidase
MNEHRVEFDFDVNFTNGGSLHATGFRLDIPSDDITEEALADLLVGDLRLLMVGEVRIRNKRILREPHRRPTRPAAGGGQWVELSHILEDGLVTYPGLSALRITTELSREASRQRYAPGTEFHIAHLDMVANTGTYLDVPFHRYPDGEDPSQVGLERLVDLPGMCINLATTDRRAVEADDLRRRELRGRAVLIHTGWSKNWGSEAYFKGHPYLTEGAAEYLVSCAPALVGIDTLNIDDISGGERPVHSRLLAAGILIVEHMCNLERLPDDGFTFTAAPPRLRGVGSFPVRAYAKIT